jgi:hypothetical protein
MIIWVRVKAIGKMNKKNLVLTQCQVVWKHNLCDKKNLPPTDLFKRERGERESVRACMKGVGV